MGHVDRSQAAGGGRKGTWTGRRQPGRTSATQRRQQRGSQTLDRLLGEGAEVPASFLQSVEELDTRDRVAADERCEERFDRLLFDQTEDAIVFFIPGTCTILDLNSKAETGPAGNNSDISKSGQNA